VWFREVSPNLKRARLSKLAKIILLIKVFFFYCCGIVVKLDI